MNTDVSHANMRTSSRWPLLVALAIGVFAALLTISLQHRLFPQSGITAATVFAIVLPGMLGNFAINGNVHDFDLGIAAGINSVFYFFLVWLVCTTFRWIVQTLKWGKGSGGGNWSEPRTPPTGR